MFVSVPILPGVRMAAVQTDKFKTGFFSVNLLRPLCREEAALNALLPSVLLRGSREHPSMRKISAWLDSLYGASAGSFVRKRGEVQSVGFYADFLSDHLTPGGEEILRPMIDFTAGILLRPAMRKGTFLKSYVEGEKTNLINDIEASLNEKRAYASRQLIRTMCADEAYGVSRMGEAEEVRAITRESLLEHWQGILETSRMEIFYLGTEDPERVADA
ncbi:MAG: insulinase family protein, partial [Oscillospiraceae bacterium]|nr:insulinase family protein [Oscillospiraceae bacterium]